LSTGGKEEVEQMRILAIVMATILTVLCLVACGGGDEEEGAPAAAASPSATEGAPSAPEGTPPGTGTPLSERTPTAPRTPGAAATPSEGGLTTGSLADLDSYRYTMNMELEGLESVFAESLSAIPGQDPAALAESLTMEVTGAYVAPDKIEVRMSISGVDDELAMTTIGDQQWVEMGDLAIGPIQAVGDIEEMNLASIVWDGFSADTGGLTCTSEKKETVNGVASNYCGIDAATFEQLADLFGGTGDMGDIDEFSLDLWLAEDGDWPVRMRANVAGTDETGKDFRAKLELDVTDVNEDFDIKAPS